MEQSKIRGFLKLVRPANIITAWSNILVGAAIAYGTLNEESLPMFDFINYFNFDIVLLIISTSGLYGGGIVMNDYFDANLDAKERPERPIPKGLISKKNALNFAIILYTIGVISAFCVNIVSGIIACSLVGLTLIYNTFSKHNSFLGPLNMGICRAVNWLLGMSICATFFSSFLLWLIIPLLYIFGITLVSRSEVIGEKGNNLIIGVGLYIFVILVIALSGLSSNRTTGIFIFFMLMPFIIYFFHKVLKPTLLAINGGGKPELVMKAVKSAVIGVIIVDASVAVIFLGIIYGVIILVLMPSSIYLSKRFAVT